MGLFSRKQSDSAPGSRDSSASSRRMLADDLEEQAMDPAAALKKRARRRLVGAIALVLGAIVFLPMVFDSEPQQVAENIDIQIPDRDTPFEADPQSSVPETAPATVSGSSDPDAVPSRADVPVEPPQTTPPRPVQPTPAPVPPAATDDGARALALLEGRDPDKASTTASGSFAVQVGAFSSADAIKDVRAKLASAGLKSYTETLKTPQGERTRVRLGPYASRDAAEQARTKLKGIGLDGTVVSL